MILRFNYEELRALSAGARALLAREMERAREVETPSLGGRLSEGHRFGVEELPSGLEGDLSVHTLEELGAAREGVDAVVAFLRVEMETHVVATHVADEGAVAAYFDFAHVLTVAYRIGEMEAEMEALIELMTGAPPTAETRRTFRFPD